MLNKPMNPEVIEGKGEFPILIWTSVINRLEILIALDICEQYSTRIKTLTYFGQPICSYHFESAKKKKTFKKSFFVLI